LFIFNITNDCFEVDCLIKLLILTFQLIIIKQIGILADFNYFNTEILL